MQSNLPNSLDDLWTLDIKKSTATPPEEVKRNLSVIIQKISEGSKRTWTYRGKKETSDNIVHVWNRLITRDGSVLYEVNPDHPLVESIVSAHPEMQLQIEMLLKQIGMSLPVNSLYIDLTNDEKMNNDSENNGIDSIFGICLSETSKNPVEILNKMMVLPFCHMHGPEHHVMVGAALLAAYKNAGGDIDLTKSLTEMKNRGGSVPGGACGFWGACGAGISTGMFISIISDSTPLSSEPFGLSNRMTSKSLDAIGTVGGPRCCKRDSYLSILSAIDFVREHFNVEMERPEIVCEFSPQNNQCLGKRCPFSKANHSK